MVYDFFTEEDIEKWIEKANQQGVLTNRGIELPDDYEIRYESSDRIIYKSSLQELKNLKLAILIMGSKRALGIFDTGKGDLSVKTRQGFEGIFYKTEKVNILFCPMDHKNAVNLRKIFTYTAPSPLSDRDITFGVGDRLGIASPGHLRIFKRYNANPVLAQQSVRELNLTGRNYEEVLDSASWAVFQERYEEPWGADGDHLKTEDWVKKALSLGFTMLTADVSDYIRGEYENCDRTKLETDYNALDEKYRKDIEKEYLNMEFNLESGEVLKFEKEQLMRITLIYREAIEHATRLYKTAVDTRGEDGFDFELSIDETETPTTPQAHLFIARETQKKGIKIASLAPRFIGEFQKAIDYKGEVDKFETAFKKHCEIARKLGYRISVHSGSDKFSVFPSIGKLSEGKFHIKTAGTNWLEALRVIATEEPTLFRKLYKYARDTYKKAREYYHVTPNLGNLPNIDLLVDSQLVNILDNPDARQVLHITYGEMLSDTELKEKIYSALFNHIEEYWDNLENHIGKHLKLLGVGRKGI